MQMAITVMAPRPLAAKWCKINRTHEAKVVAEKEARGWEFHDEYDGTTLPLVPGRRFRVYDKPGWFKFRQFIVSPHEGELIECYGPFTLKGKDKVGCGTRTFKADRVKLVARRVGETRHEERVRKINSGRKRKQKKAA